MTICYAHNLNSDVTLRLIYEYLYFQSFDLSENVKSNIFIDNSTNSIQLYQKILLEFRFSGILAKFTLSKRLFSRGFIILIIDREAYQL